MARQSEIAGLLQLGWKNEEASRMYEVSDMPDDLLPPRNCTWWQIGESTPNPPEDRDFLTDLSNAGFKTFIAEGGLMGALSDDRMVEVIHRGFGRRWRLGFLKANKEELVATVQALPKRVSAVAAWMNGKAIDEVVQLLSL